jgi:hypothetical protein
MWLLAALLLPSLAILKKLPVWVMAVYVAGGLVGLSVACLLYPFWRRRIPESGAKWIGISILAVLVAAFWMVHPLIDHDGFVLLGRSFGSSDADDAIDLAISRAFSGLYPYGQNTFLGLPISPLPGTLILALPFYVLGESALQNIFWLAMGWLFLARAGREGYGRATYLLVLLLVLSPAVAYCVLQGGDTISNGIYVAIAMVSFIARCQTTAFSWKDIAVAIGLALAFSSRANFFALVPYAGCLALRQNARKAVLIGITAAVLWAAITLPFYFADPAGFAPLQTLRRIGWSDFPLLSRSVPMLAITASVVAGCMDPTCDIHGFLRRCFHIQIFLVIAGFLLSSLSSGQPELSMLNYGLMPIGFALAGYGAPLLKSLEHCGPNTTASLG